MGETALRCAAPSGASLNRLTTLAGNGCMRVAAAKVFRARVFAPVESPEGVVRRQLLVVVASTLVVMGLFVSLSWPGVAEQERGDAESPDYNRGCLAARNLGVGLSGTAVEQTRRDKIKAPRRSGALDVWRFRPNVRPYVGGYAAQVTQPCYAALAFTTCAAALPLPIGI
jgi:hypothetical protein